MTYVCIYIHIHNYVSPDAPPRAPGAGPSRTAGLHNKISVRVSHRIGCLTIIALYL